MSHLEQEIQSQPQFIANLVEQATPLAKAIAEAIHAYKPRFVSIVARGTSDNAARYAQYLFGIEHQWVVALATPSVHTLYGVAPRYDGALVIGISQSGQSEDVCQVLEDADEQGALTISLTNDAASPLAKLAKFHLDIQAGEEKSVAATKTYTSQLTAIALLSAALSRDGAKIEALQELPDQLQQTLSFSQEIPTWIEEYKDIPHFAALGRGYNYSTAHEISLKIKELCYIPGEEYSEADFRHGPIALVQENFPLILIAPHGKTLDKQADLLAQLHAKGATSVVITNADLARHAQHILSIPSISEWLSPIVSVLPGQIFALNLALARGYDVDQPRGLKKVTITA